MLGVTYNLEEWRLVTVARPGGWVTFAVLDDGVQVVEDVDVYADRSSMTV